MPIPMSCPQCQKAYKLSDDKQGKQIRCRACSHVFRVAKPPANGAIADMKNKVPIYVGPLKDNKTGKVVIDKTYGNLDPYLDQMDYLLEGVVGSIT